MIPTLLDELDQIRCIQEGLNDCYQNLIDFILSEAVDSMDSVKKKRKCRKFKEYWDEELGLNWKRMKESERVLRTLKKKGACTSEARTLFRNDRKRFDKMLRNKKRVFIRINRAYTISSVS